MKISPFLLLMVSILLETSKNIFSNHFSKEQLKNETDIYKFNTCMYIGSFLVLCMFKSDSLSVYTLIIALLFSLAIWLNQYCYLKALKFGSMGITTFIQGIALVIPIIYGIFMWGEKVALHQAALLAVLIAALWLSLNIKKEGLNIKWLLYSAGAMLFLGIIGILQSTHQMSSHKSESIPLLQLTFLFAAAMNAMGWIIKAPREPSCFRIRGNAAITAVFSGIFMGLVHTTNLYLAGTMDKIIFFSVSNGGLIFITLLSGLVFFKEKLTLKQWFGIIIGTIALSFIGI